MSLLSTVLLASLNTQQFAQKITFAFIDLSAKYNALDSSLKAEYEAKLRDALAADQIEDEDELEAAVSDAIAEVTVKFETKLGEIEAENAAKNQVDAQTVSDLIAQLAENNLLVDEVEEVQEVEEVPFA